ncbi:MAG: hypothetical protein QOJ80_5015 [Mycobacterium sp.]|nr:hypothetical protein [Mycobacterium sp.]
MSARRWAIGFASTAVMIVAAPASGQTRAGEVVLDTVNASTPVSAYGGVAVWSAFDAASKTYQLRAYRDGQVSDVPVPPRHSPFDADVGPDATGRPVVVYSRCRVDQTGGLFFNELPEWGFARGCDIHRFRFADGTDRTLAAARSKVRSEVTPSIWGSHLAYFAVGEPRHGPRSTTARLDLADLSGKQHTRRYRGGDGRKLDRFAGKVSDGPSPTSLDLRRTTMTYGWSNLETCPQGEGDSSGEAQAAQIWRQSSTRRKRLASECQGLGVFGPFFDADAIRWVAPQPLHATALKSSIAGHDIPLPAYTVGAALDGPNLIVARGTETGPTQIVSLPVPSAGP